MKKLLLALILSFLVFINIRLWGMREAEFLLPNSLGGRATCDMPTPQEEAVEVTIQNQNCQSCEGQRQFSRLKARLARVVAFKKYKQAKSRHENAAQMQEDKELVAETQQPADYLPRYQTVQQMLNNSLAEFIACSGCNELTLHQLIDLMNAELKLIETLVYPTMGNRHYLIQSRSDLLDQAVPSVRLVYDKILSFATYNELLNNQFSSQDDHGRNLHLSLNFYNKKIFLHTMYQRLSNLKQQIQKMQYKLVLNQANYRT